MSVNRNMKSCKLLKQVKKRTHSGATHIVWVEECFITASISKKSEFKHSDSLIWKESTHVGLTWRLGLESGLYRLECNGKMYDISSVDESSRLINLVLRVVE